ncbi:MAG: hypothetical protein AVDCRST_MAG60-556 [uncultured Nocardioides sp.]|uniref:CHRD domain-containing protein n=1 Tax=uncultured Nocardioides sp. TaxID=198441 RepID=A0A6J4N389_9ACTN|nr:MAG: hypothetical protein AVDCRST_MAG60-556 [uncultured Nocardioides sp.]
MLPEKVGIMNPFRTKVALNASVLIATTAVAATMATSPASAKVARDATETKGRLTALNNSGIAGSAEAVVNGRRLIFDIDARKVLKGMPHAQHIHFGAQARHECPTAARDDENNDHRLTTTDGAPAYGPVRISLTTKGDSSAKSVLAVDRFPTPERSTITYNRQIRTSKALARAIRRGQAVYVLHGLDYNGNGKYDFDGAGASDLDPSLPAEATDPAACSVLNPQN